MAEAFLALEDGAIFRGEAFGARATSVGEVVFNTSMTGYQEILTDPSYAGQIVTPTYPLIGNYGVNKADVESRRIQVRGFVVRQHCDRPSHQRNEMTVHDYLAAEGVPGLAGVDTRAITRRLRNRGVMMGVLTSEATPDEAMKLLRDSPAYGDQDYVRSVTAEQGEPWSGGAGPRRRITVVDMGVKHNILRLLRARGCDVATVPASTSAEDILAANPDGILLSPGPGDPAPLDYMIASTKTLLGRRPIMGICLGHQVVAHALGGTTYKLKFGHRGGNHPVRDNETGRVYITAQNHGYAVDADSLPPEAEVSHVNLHDGTVEGFRHTSMPLLTIQYHSEAAPGPLDNVEMFDRFLSMVDEAR